MAAKNDAGVPNEKPPEVHATAQTNADQQVRIRFDEQNLRTSYANNVRINATADEVLLDFGLLGPYSGPGQTPGQAEFVFTVGERIVMNFFQAKRLALALGQLIRRHEEQFGELELDVTKRRRPTT